MNRLNPTVLLFVFSIIAFPSLSCLSQPVETVKQAEPGEPFELGVGETAELNGFFTVRFLGVTQDSRCPKDVVCVWQGNGQVKVILTTPGGTRETGYLNTTTEPQDFEFETYRFELTELSPYPVTTEEIDSLDYKATLNVEVE